MKQSIFVLAMTLYPVFFENDHSLEDHLVGYSTEGNLIHACHFYSDPYIYQILDNLNHRNTPLPNDLNDYVEMNYEFLELIIDSNQDLRYQPLPWLNDRIRSYFAVTGYGLSSGYFFYITGNVSSPTLEIVARLKNSDHDLDETNCGDDFTYIKELAHFIDRYLYYDDCEDYYADTMAKLLLQFG